MKLRTLLLLALLMTLVFGWIVYLDARAMRDANEATEVQP